MSRNYLLGDVGDCTVVSGFYGKVSFKLMNKNRDDQQSVDNNVR